MQYFTWAVISGILLWLSWPVIASFTFLVFLAFIPLLYAEDKISASGKGNTNLLVFGTSYTAFFIWNALTTWWVYNASLPGAIMAILANSLLMTIPFMLFHISKKSLGSRLAYIALVSYWIAFEYIHLSWELSWPWLTLGNVFAMHPAWVQWYEFTGVFGGTFWVWTSNILLFSILRTFIRRKSEHRSVKFAPFELGLVILFISLPIFISYQVGKRVIPFEAETEVVVVQPNIDPYEEKFDQENLSDQINKLISLSEQLSDSNTSLVIWPETAIPQPIQVDELWGSQPMGPVGQFLEENPHLNLVTGFSGYQLYDQRSEKTVTARPLHSGNGWYDYFNSALMVNNVKKEYGIYHKSKLVPGVERMPYPGIFKFTEVFAIDLGGISGSLGTSPEAKVFAVNDELVVAPIICYESIYGGFTADFIKKGANLITIITNDGWWGHTPGYKQHFHYATLRAIETRRYIARSANTGISGFIDARGNIIQASEYWVEDVMKQPVKLNNVITFYVEHGDFIARIAAYLSVFLLLVLLAKRIMGDKAKYFR